MNIRSIEDLAIRNERRLEGQELSIKEFYERIEELEKKVAQLEKKLKKTEKVEKV